MSSGSKILHSNIHIAYVPEPTVGEYIWNTINSFDTGSICLIDALTDEKLNIGDLKRLSHSIAVALVNRGVTKTDRLVYSGQNSIQHTVLRFVAMLMGLPICPLSSTFDAYEVEQEVTSMSATVAITSVQDLSKFKRVLELDNNIIELVVIFNATRDTHVTERHVTYEQLVKEGRYQMLKYIPYFPVDPNVDPFLLIHTSGSTGRPKCVILKHRSMLNLLSERGHLLDPGDSANRHVVANPNPMGHISGSIIVPLQLCLDVTLVIYSEFSVDLLFRSIEKYGVTFMPVFPSFARKLIEGDLCRKYDLSSLRAVNTGGAAFPSNIARAIIDKYHVQFREGYAMTEYMLITRGTDINQPYIPGNLGPVSPGTELKVIDTDTGSTLGPNTDGELWVRGYKMFAGYLDREKIGDDGLDGEGWYRTGDIGHYDERENIFITDRLKEVIRIGVKNMSIKISPVEIEHYLLTHPSIAECAVVGVNNRAGTQWPRAYVVPKVGAPEVNAKEIKMFVADTLSHTKQLRGGVIFVSHIQRINIGKVDRKYYRKLVSHEILD